MENEEFISWGCEDCEIYNRFNILDLKFKWIDYIVYHIEHSRGENSSISNPHVMKNSEIEQKISKMNKDELFEYYSNVEYLKKYNIIFGK